MGGIPRIGKIKLQKKILMPILGYDKVSKG